MSMITSLFSNLVDNLVDNLLKQSFYIQDRKMCFSKKISLFFVLLGAASPLKAFYMSMHSTKRKT